MRAVVVTQPGGPEVLAVKELPDPEVPFGHVRIRSHFVGVNRADLLQRMGVYPAPPGVPVDIPGLEYAGVIDAVGAGATRFAVGARVHGLVAGGAYAERIVAHEREVAATPEGVSDEDAAAVPEAFVTAYDALVVRGRVKTGDAVLIHACGSGVGTAAVQLAARLGCRVLGTSRSVDKLERCKPLGLHAGVVPKKEAFCDEVRALTSGRGADVVIDLVGGAYTAESVRCAAYRGRVVVVGMTGGSRTDLDLRALLMARVELIGTVLRSRPLEEKIEAADVLARRVDPGVASGALKAIVEATFPMAEAGRAHELVAGNGTFGKVLLDCR